ncbi:response regulator [Entomospira entomophila]|uniref:Response regulator n=1 Tax=Entomospira entomophila TaxID=2719988 RepID=A0A968G8P1_9SPIO|nr:response regulator [Entomospira entomophilus]NIZ40026.1 response regulator [Entomospira entomophilus]WDI35586.1 response regulator [Entomospira entomophilus]
MSSTQHTAPGIGPSGAPYRVLVVDDSVFVQKQLKQILTSELFEVVDVANDGLEGVNKYKAINPPVDLVTMDITMPNMDGITALKAILEHDPNARVIMISAIGREDLVKQALIAGAKNYMVKPLDRKKVIERISNIF